MSKMGLVKTGFPPAGLASIEKRWAYLNRQAYMLCFGNMQQHYGLRRKSVVFPVAFLAAGA
jgi:hypothetical protein